MTATQHILVNNAGMMACASLFTPVRWRDFNTPNQHNYEATLSPEEIGQLIEKLGDLAWEGDSTATALAAALSPKLVHMLRLVALCVRTEPPRQVTKAGQVT